MVYGTDAVGQIGYLNEGDNTLSMTWMGGFTSHVQNIYSNLSGTHYQVGDEATSDRGNGAVWFFGMGASGNDCDYVFTYEQAYTVIGGRYESGGRFMETSYGSHHPSINIINVEINDYNTDKMFYMRTAGTLQISNCRMIKNGGGIATLVGLDSSGNYGTLIIDGGGVKLAGGGVVYAREGGTWKVYQRGLMTFSDDAGVFTNAHLADVNGVVLN